MLPETKRDRDNNEKNLYFRQVKYTAKRKLSFCLNKMNTKKVNRMKTVPES